MEESYYGTYKNDIKKSLFKIVVIIRQDILVFKQINYPVFFFDWIKDVHGWKTTAIADELPPTYGRVMVRINLIFSLRI